jgi:L-threonylcarbamoyladenylate synthase
MEKETAVFYLDEENPESVAERVGFSLKRGGVCVVPTDTIYGIVALERFKESVKEIYRIKGRSKDKPLIHLIGSKDNLKTYTHQPLPESLERYWPGPLTIIFQGIHENKISIRLPAGEFLQKLFEKINFSAIVAPSANPSGEENILECEKLVEAFHGKVEIIVCKKEALKEALPSTIIDISGREWRLVREGEVKLDGVLHGRTL